MIQDVISRKTEPLHHTYPFVTLSMKSINVIDFLLSTSKDCRLIRNILLLALSNIGTHWKTKSWCERRAVELLIDEDLLHCLKRYNISGNALLLVYERLKYSKYSKDAFSLIQEQLYFYKLPKPIREEIQGYKENLLC